MSNRKMTLKTTPLMFFFFPRKTGTHAIYNSKKFFIYVCGLFKKHRANTSNPHNNNN